MTRPIRHVLAALACVVAMGAFQGSRAEAQEALQPGEAFVTRFSGTVVDGDRVVIDPDGAVGSIIDIRTPGGPPRGEHWWNEPQRDAVSAGEVGQVFGVALDDAAPPNVYLTATSAFGLHRNADNTDWMAGLWGPDGGPGTVYRLSAASDYEPEVFARVTLDGRLNSGAALGNIAFDRWNRQFYVSDLETGMIHRLRASDGFDLGRYDHGLTGRTRFFDAETGAEVSLGAVTFDPAARVRIDDCPTGDVARTPSCWNFADFRRRVWGVGVRRDPLTGTVRLYYSVWGSQGFGNPDFAAAGDDQRNAIWSVRIDDTGDFDAEDVRREFLLPDFFRSPEAIARAGRSHPVTDIAFAAFGDQDVMLLAERGGVRNLGLDAEDAFATPQEARVLRYELDDLGAWRPVGRYDVGRYDRGEDGPPYVRAGASGGVSFGMGYGESWEVDTGRLDAFVWMSGDALCSPRGLCFDSSAGEHNDSSQVHGIQGRVEGVFEEIEPEAAFQPYPSPGPATPEDAPDSSFMIDTDINVDADDNGIEEELTRDDATRVGDVEVYQPAPDPAVRPDEGAWYGPWEESWPWPVPEGDVPPLPAPPTAEGWPELGIEKSPADCPVHGACPVAITIINNGPGAYEGPLHVLETPDGGRLVDVITPGWTCEQPGGIGAIGCRSDWMRLEPGESTTLQLLLGGYMFVFDDPPPAFVERTNCAFIIWPAALEGPARVRAVEAALLLLDFDPGPVDGVADALTYAAIDDYRLVAGLPPGGIDAALMDALFPGLSGMPGDGVEGNDWDCAPMRFPVPEGGLPPEPGAGGGPGDGADAGDGAEPLPEAEVFDVDLHVVKEIAPGLCEVGATCTFLVTVINEGGTEYTGDLVIQDVAGIFGVAPLDDGSIEPVSAELGCEIIPDSGVYCSYADEVTLAGHGGYAHFLLQVAVPADFTGQLHNCAWVAWSQMAFPTGHDFNPGNDEGCAQVRFDAGPPEAAEEPEEAEPIELNFQATKTGPERCARGQDCEFTITITSLMDIAFEGAVSVVDTVAGTVDGHREADPALSDDDLELFVGGWDCGRDADGQSYCRIDDGVIGPHDSVELRATVRVPEGFSEDHDLSNCASVALLMEGAETWFNPSVCAVAETYSLDDIDLAIGKRVLGGQTCRPGDQCAFVVEVTNKGTEPFDGTVVIEDYANVDGVLDVPASAIYATADWDCTGIGLLPTMRRCSWTGTLGMEETQTALIYVNVTEAIVVDAELENCARISWSAMDFPGGRDSNPTNDERVCATAPISAEPAPHPGPASAPHQIDLRVEKHGPEACRRGEVCEFQISVHNDGPGSYFGPLAILDRLYPTSMGIATEAPVVLGAEGACVTTASVHTVRCLHQPLPRDAAVLERFHAFAFSVRWIIPEDMPLGRARNCARVLWPELLHELYERIYFAEVMLDRLGFGPGPIDGHASSQTDAAVRAYRESVGLPVSDDIDDALIASLYAGTAMLPGDRYSGNDEHCATFDIVDRGADISIISDTVCQRGESCRVDARLENVGTEPFEGGLGMRGQLSPAVPISSVTSQTSGLKCSVTGEATYECFGEGLSIAPGRDNALRIEVVADIPPDFGPNEISHIKKVLWPDPLVQDTNAINDRHISTILIESPAQPQAQPAPDLTITKIARQGSCVAQETCGFAITVANAGAGTFVGPIRVSDIVASSGARLTDSGPSPWSCRGSGGRYTCTHPATTLAPGETRSFTLTFRTRSSRTGPLENCAEFAWNEAARVFAVQSALNGLGFESGRPDGKAGSLTRGAVRAFQASVGMTETGRIDDALMARLFDAWGDGDANASNDRDCAVVDVEAAPEPQEAPAATPEPSQPAACTGGRYRNNQGQCVCPSSRPNWTGRSCVESETQQPEAQQPETQQPEAQQPQQRRCSGGRTRNDQGRCVCPSGRPVWTGIVCIPRILPQQQQEACTGGRYRDSKGQCVCPRRRPVWNGERCVRRGQGQTPNVTPSPN